MICHRVPSTKLFLSKAMAKDKAKSCNRMASGAPLSVG